MTLYWNDTLKIGQPHIDEQHRQIFAAFAEFLEACEKQRGATQIVELFSFLDEYTRQHFAEEEALMEKLGFPESDQHRREHQRFMGKLDELKRDLASSGPTVKVLILTTKALVYWLTEHIRDVDTRLARFARGEPGALAGN